MRKRSITPGVIRVLRHRDSDRCYLCGGRPGEDPWEVEHVVAFSKGGSDDLSNLKLSHRSCNRRKAVS